MASEKMPEDIKSINIPEILPIIQLNSVVFPKMIFPLEVVDEHSIKLIDEAMAKDRLMGLIMFRNDSPDGQDKCPLAPNDIGTCVVILKMAKGGDNRTQLLVQGLNRFKIVECLEDKPYLQARIAVLEDEGIKDIETEALMHNLATLFDQVV